MQWLIKDAISLSILDRTRVRPAARVSSAPTGHVQPLEGKSIIVANLMVKKDGIWQPVGAQMQTAINFSSVIIDFDGTLFDTRRAISATLYETFAVYNVPPPSQERVEAIIGRGITLEETLTDVDIRYARHIGATACWAAYGYGDPDECRLLHPEFIAASPNEIAHVVCHERPP